MHETVICKQIIDEANKCGKVTGITVEVGDLAHVNAEEFRESIGNMVDWDIHVTQKKAKVRCKSCGFEGEPKILEHTHDATIFACPRCNENFPEILEGEDIILVEVETED